MPFSPYGPQIVIRENNQQPQQPQEPPMRVQMAMMLFGHLTSKTRKMVAATENQIEVIDGQKLTEEEEGTRATALNALSHYFAGTLQPDLWESRSLVDQQGIPTMKFRCICVRADHAPNSDCPFCEGAGEMDIVVRNPRKVSVDQHGNVVTSQRTLATQPTSPAAFNAAQPQPGAPQGRRPGRGPASQE
jgi:hypothetical protein